MRSAGMSPVIGTAGWSIPAKDAVRFDAGGSALQRYATRFGGVEINSSFHRPHRRLTWERWAESVPASFLFSVKVPKTISHERKLVACEALLSSFLEEVDGLGDKLAILLLQLPPKLAFDPDVAAPFFSAITVGSRTRVVCEPRHPSWFEPAAEAALARMEIARVAADPAIVPAAAHPGGWPGLRYWRLHGSPRMYRSTYDDGRLDQLGAAVGEAAQQSPTWCIFDNTAASAATSDALELSARLASGTSPL